VLLLAFGIPLGITMLALPVIMAVQFLFTLGIVYFTATYNVFFRDLRYIVQHILTALFFLTPIMYDFSIIPPKFHVFLNLNPLTHIIDAYRNVFFYKIWPTWDKLGYVLALSVLLVFLGAQIFERHREVFAEYL
jgi:ABC-2 type transport system permease protein